MERLGEVDTIGFECAEVGVDGGDGDLKLVCDLFEGVSVFGEAGARAACVGVDVVRWSWLRSCSLLIRWW